MSLLLAPVLAQLLTLGLSDRTEARLIVSEEDEYAEGSTNPTASLDLAWRRAGLTLAYSPYITITPPGPEPREIVLFHTVTTGARYQYQWRRTTLRFSEAASYGQHDYRAELLAPRRSLAPTAGGGTPTQGGTMTPGGGTPGGTPTTPGSDGAPQSMQPRRASDLVVHYGTSTTAAALTHAISRRVSLDVTGSYSLAGGFDEESREAYPVVQGPQLSLTVATRIARRDSVLGQLWSQYAFSDDGTRSSVTTLTGGWTHGFAARTSLSMSAGASLTWSELVDDSWSLTLYPVFGVGLTHSTRPRNGMFTFTLGASATPVLDPTTAEVDPRLGLLGGVSWNRERLTIGAVLSSALSLSEETEEDSLNSIFASITAGYELGAGFFVDAGARTAWQTFGDQTILPPSWAFFLGVTWAAELPLN